MRGLVALCVAAALGASGAGAEGLKLSSKNRLSGLKAKFAVLDGRAARQYADSARLRPKAEDKAAVPRYTGRYDGPFIELAKAAARRHGIPEDLFLRLVHRESGFNADAVSHKGAIGLAQLMPGTAARMAVDPLDPEQNLDGGARYLRMQYDRFGSWKLALAAYNAGPEAVTKYAGVPPYDETVTYVAAILGGG